VTEGIREQGRGVVGEGAHASPSSPTLRGRRLLFARAAWVAVAVAALGTFLISIPTRYAQLAHSPTAAVRTTLAEMGLSAGGYALYNVTLDTVFVSVFTVVVIVIFWRRSDDPMALLVATTLVVWGPQNGLLVQAPGAIEGIHPALDVMLGLLAYAGYMVWMLFFYLFPSGRFVPRWTRWLYAGSFFLALGSSRRLVRPAGRYRFSTRPSLCCGGASW
jgi:hypothetical protein